MLNVDRYKAHLEKLSREERAELAHFLLSSLDPETKGGMEKAQPAEPLSVLLDRIAAELRNAPALSDEAVSRAGIYADHS